jgi:VanZ like family
MRDDQPVRLRVMPFVLAVAASLALILAAPFIGEIRRTILARFPGQFVHIIGGIVAVAVGAALVTAFARIRDRRAIRYTAIALALAIATAYAFISRTGDPQVDAVERFHFVEYGLVTWLFYRAWRRRQDISTIVLPILAGLLVGTVEEWFQWFIPARVGDVRDVFLNGVAISTGLIFSLAVDPPERFSASLAPAALRRIGAFAAVTILVFAAFFHSVQVGYAIAGDGWRFRSCYTAAALDALAADRAERWRNTYIERPKRLSAEDQYMTEGLWHVQHRNKAWTAGDVATAWRENLILERYFAPVLDSSSYISRTGHRWGPDHRVDAERRFTELRVAGDYESTAQPAPIHVWSKRAYWTSSALLAAVLALPALLQRFRAPRHAARVGAANTN